MKAVLLLALKSAWARRLTLGIMLVAIALATALLLAVERLRADARHGFIHAASGVDLVVGPRGSGVQLLLHAVFHAGAASHAMRRDSFEALARHPAVDWALPLALGDSHHGFAVLGTRSEYFARYRYGDGQSLAFTAGQAFGPLFEAVLGSAVAAELGYRIGERIALSHGLEHDGHDAHEDKPVTVVGILAPTGTPVDRSVFVSLETITALHLDWAAGARLPGLSIAAEHVRKFDLQPKEISAALIGLKNRAEVFRVQRFINGFRDEPLMAVMPGVALDELWRTLAAVERSLFAISALVVLIGLAGLTATMLAGLDQRRRELAILRALGAGPGEIFTMLLAEGLLVTMLGVLLGCALLALGIAALAPLLQARFGVPVTLRPPSANEFGLLLAIVGTGLLASLAPGYRAWRMALADGLTPRT